MMFGISDQSHELVSGFGLETLFMVPFSIWSKMYVSSSQLISITDGAYA